MNKFTVHYKTSKRHVKAKERDELLIAGEIEPISATDYRYIAKPRILTNFQALADLKQPTLSDSRRYISGNYIFELGEKRYYERQLETPAGLQLRLQSQPLSA